MKILIIFAGFAILLCLLSCEQNEGSPVSIKEKPELSFLVNNADLIAIIEITEARSKGPDSKLRTAKIARAEILESFVGDLKGKIKIKNFPYFKAEGAIFHVSMLRNGKYFAFLKRLESRDGSYVPLTGSALLSIFDGKVQPVWKIDDTIYYGDGLKLLDVVKDIRSIGRKTSSQ